MSLTALIFAFAFAAAGAAPSITLKAGDACTASAPLKLTAKRKPVPIAKGTAIRVTAVKGATATVTAGGQTGEVALKELTGKCAKPPAPAAAAKPDVTLDLGAGPIVKTEKQAEVSVAQAASQTAADDTQVELTLPPGRAATLVYTPILNGGGAGVDAVLPALDRRLPQVLASIQSFGTRAGPSVSHALDSESKRCRVDDACLARIGKKFHADAVLAGTLTLSSDTYHLEFRLVDPKTGKTSDRAAQDFPNQGLQPLIDHSIDTVRIAVRELIVEEYGRLILRVSEPRTQVRLDGRLIALTPMAARPVSPGDHQLDLALEDFRPYQGKVTINALEDVTVNVVLERSDDFVRRYKEHAGLVRKIAWASLGVGLGGVAGAVGLVVAGAVINNNAYNKYEAPKKQLTTAQLTQVQNISHEADVLDGVAIGAGILGALGLGTAAVLFLAGDDPNAYDHPPKPLAVQLSFLPGGIAVNGTF
jgi:hypothetical protein